MWVCPLHTCRYDPEFEVSLGAVHKLLRSWSVGSTLTWLKSAEIARNASGCLFLCCYGFSFIGIQIFARSCFFLHQLFFFYSFLYSLIYFHFLHHNQVIECLGCAFGMFIIHCNHETLQLFTWIFPVCLTLFRRFALRGPAPADSLKRTPSRRSCKHH